MKKTQRTLQLRTETVRTLSAELMPQVAGGAIAYEPRTTSSVSKQYTHCHLISDCVDPLPK